MRKRLLSLAMALAMIVGFAAWVPELSIGSEIKAGAYTAHTREEAINWIRSQVGKSIEWTDASNLYQCVDFVQAYYAYLGVQPYIHNAGNYSWADDAVPSGWQRIKGAQPQPGDILIYTNSGAGHVGLYESDYCHYHQNLRYSDGYHRYVEKITWKYNGFNDPYWGVIRPDFISDKTPPTISNVRVYDADNNGYTVECTVTDEGGSGLDHVQFPTWTLENDQDDIKWTDGTISGSTVTFRVNISDHNYEYGIYRTHIYAYDNAGNYSSTAVPDVSVGVGHEMSEDEAAGQTIPDGNYWIVSELGKNAFLDIYGVEYPAADFTKIIACEVDDDLRNDVFDTWTVTYLNNGFYKITQNGVNVAMEVPYASLSTNSLVKTYEENNSPAQQWSISRTNHGYAIRSRANGYYLDVQGAVTGGNVMTYDGHDGTNQSWSFVPFCSDDRPVADGEYYIKSAAYKLYIGTQENGAYVGNTALDKFVLKYISDGYYTITEKSTGLSISVSDTGDSEYLKVSKRIVLKDYAEPCRNNLWRIVDKGNGEFCLISKCNGYYIDFDEFSTNVQSNQYSNYDTQRWSFIKEHKHSYTSKVTKNPTCTSTGIRKYTCSCGDSYTKTIPKLGHSYNETIVAPTSAAKGYTLHKCSRCGDEYKDNFTVLALKLTKQPKNTTALKAGDTITFKIDATGNGLKYEWYIKDIGGDWKKTAAVTNQYDINLTTARNGRQVFCKVIDANGKSVRSNIAVGNIAGTVIVVEQPKDVTVWNAGDTANFTVKGAGHGLKYEWYVKDPGGNWIKTGAVESTYSISISKARNGRQVFCKIIDFKGRSVRTNVVKANIAGTVVIMEQPKNVTVAKAGDTATFTIKSVGHGMKYEWYVKDPKGSWTKTGATTNKYSVSITKARNGRQVFCKVIDFKNRSVRSNIVTAKIK